MKEIRARTRKPSGMSAAVRHHARPGGFTILELLVSMAVLALLVVLVAQLTNSATLTITGSRKHMDADSQARMILDRMAIDIGCMVMRGDVDCIVKGSNADDPNQAPTMLGNDAVFFFSEAPGYWPSKLKSAQKSLVTLVGYRINETATTSAPAYVLERLASAVGWETVTDSTGKTYKGLTFLTPDSATSTSAPGSTIATGWSTSVGTIVNNYTDGTSTDFQAIGEQVFRFEYCYLLKNGSFSLVPFIAPHTSAQGMQDVSAIVVAIAILDSTSRKITADLKQLSNALPDVTAADLSASPPVLMAESWKNAINSPAFATTAGIPRSAASQVRVYQRFFYLNNAQ